MFSITRTTYNAVSGHGSRRPRYNGAAVYIYIYIYQPVREVNMTVLQSPGSYHGN